MLQAREPNPDNKTVNIFIPAMMCDSCVGILTTFLMPFVYNQDPKNLTISLSAKKAVITVKESLETAVLLSAIEEAGYNKPKPSLNKSNKRNCFSVESDEEEEISDELFSTNNGPLIYNFNIATAKTPACLEGITKKLEVNGIESTFDSNNNTISVTPNNDVFPSKIIDIILSTNHKIASARKRKI